MVFPYDFAILGGDMKQVYLAKELERRGFRVITYGCVKEASVMKTAQSLQDVLENAKTVIGPIPLTKNNRTVNSEQGSIEIDLEELLSALRNGQCFAAGLLTAACYANCNAEAVKIVDFMKDEELLLFNTFATAEGAIAEAITNSHCNLHRNKCLVVGYGRCGSTLAAKLSGLDAEIEVCEKSLVHRSLAQTEGYFTVLPEELVNRMDSYLFIFNTAPELIFDETLLKQANSDVLIIDIASAPGGVDFAKAEQLKVHAKQCLGLPGKYSPKDSAEALLPQILRL